MAFIQQLNVPTPDIRYFAVSDFSGGLNNRDSYAELNDNESSNMLNVDIFSEVGVVKKRDGYTRYDAFEATTAVLSIDEYKPTNAARKLVYGANTKLYMDGVMVKTTAGRPRGLTVNGYYMFVDTDEIYYYGSFPQAASDYVGIVGTPTTANVVLKLIPTTVGYTPLGSTFTSGKTIYNYTNLTVEYQPCANEVEDTYKGASFLPTSPRYIESKGGRVYLAGDASLPHTLFISDIQNPFYFPVAVSLQLNANGDKIMGMKSFHDAIIVFRSEDVHAVYGNTNHVTSDDVYYTRKIDTHTGLVSLDSVCHVNNYLYFLGNDGNVYSLHTPQTNTELLATKLINSKLDFLKPPVSALFAELYNATAVYYKDCYWLSIGTKVLVYSYLDKAWSMHDNLNATCFYIKNNELLFGGKTNRVYKYGGSYNDDGVAIACYWRSKRFDMGVPSKFKKFKSIYLIAHVFDDANADINVTFEVDYEEVSAQSDVKNLISRWGEAVWGDRFITKNINKSLPVPINKRGRLLSFIFANNKLDQSMKVYEVNGEYELRGFR